jgi:hypothetical protein
MSEDVAALLAGIKERNALVTDANLNADAFGAVYAAMVQLACVDSGFLVAAVEAVLAPHQPGRRTVLGSTCKRHDNYRFFSITATEADDVRACPDCSATVFISCAGCGIGMGVDECPVREAITRELTGVKDSTEGKAAQGG